MKLGFLVSHNGSTMRLVLADLARTGFAEAAIAISNNSASPGLAHAAQAGLVTAHLSATTHPDPAELDQAIADALADAAVTHVVLSGYMKKLGPRTLARFKDRVLNIHPSLLPDFGGAGFYGMAVHRAVLQAGVALSGATVHLVDADYDTGPVLGQHVVQVMAGDTPEDLAHRVAEVEGPLMVQVLHDLA